MTALTARDVSAAIVDQGTKDLITRLLQNGQIVTPGPGPAELTDNTTGTVSSTLAAIPAAVAATTDTSAAQLVSVNTALGVLRNEIASLNGQINALLTVLVTAGVLTQV